MPYSQVLAQRIEDYLVLHNINYYGKKMFSGICFMVDDKMCCGTHIDKQTNQSLVLCRVDPQLTEHLLNKPHVSPMNFTGKPMVGYIYVNENGVVDDAQLTYFLDLCIAFNPFAKSSKKKYPKNTYKLNS